MYRCKRLPPPSARVWSALPHFVHLLPFSAQNVDTHTHTKSARGWPPVCWGGGKAGWERGAAPGAIWQRHRHLHNVIFYLISHSKCNQKLMRALSCLADWQHDIALTPNTGALHPNDAILKPTLRCFCTKHNSHLHACVQRARASH